MKTDDLIDLLAKDEVTPKQRRPWRAAVIAGLAGLVVAVFLLASTLRLREDLGDAVMMVMMKAGFAAAFAAAALPVMLRLWRPGRPLGALLYGAAALTVIAVGATVIALAGVDPSERMQAWMGGGFPWCVVIVPILAMPTAAALLWIAKQFAPTRLTMTGAAIGGFSGGVAAMAYAMYCPIDSVPFVATWYAVAIGVCAAIGALVGSRALRW
ncbi:MAG: DUF1109 family protein [Alphaproteobacteria bacterium]|nr:DUF1109 family protein [Alphaproteobacteria bacterium]